MRKKHQPRRTRSITKVFVRVGFLRVTSCLVVKGFRIHPYLTESRFGGIAQGDLYLRFALTLSKESGAATFHAQAYIPTQPAQAIEDTRISQAHEDPRRQEGYFPPSCQGAQAGLGETRFPRLVQWRGQASALPLLCQ